jgi:catechol 2,3-dioxygenase-like lactoylglutathione lyase family enzyme
MLGTSMIVATIPVTDLDRARRFYGETLGLTFLWDNPASVRFGCGGGTELSIFRRGPSTADHTLAHFEVSDIEAVIRELEDQGVGFVDYTDGPLRTTGHIAQLGPARAAWFHDPDGNTLGLRQG